MVSGISRAVTFCKVLHAWIDVTVHGLGALQLGTVIPVFPVTVNGSQPSTIQSAELKPVGMTVEGGVSMNHIHPLAPLAPLPTLTLAVPGLWVETSTKESSLVGRSFLLPP